MTYRIQGLDPRPFERSGLGCTMAYGFENHCFTMTWPEGWQEARSAYERFVFRDAWV